MNSLLASPVYRIAARLRNPSLAAELKRLRQSESMDLHSLQQIQLERLQRFLTFANEHSPFYREQFERAGFRPATLTCTDDIKCLPVLAKADLIRNNAQVHTRYKFARTFAAETSGTSGHALAFSRNEQWDSINRAHVARAYSWYSVRPWDRNGYLWGYDISPTQASRVRMLDSLQNRFRLFRYDKASIRDFARRLQSAVYLSGYSSMIFETAKTLNEMGVRLPQLRMVKGTSEMILDVYQREAELAFGRRIVSEYGAAEAGLVAFECPSGSMHINVEDVLLEVDADGTAIVTNLASYSFPIVRYSLGDILRLDPAPCICGRSHPVLAEVVGRRGGVVVGMKQRYPALTFYYVFKNIAVRDQVLLNYRVVQEQRGRCRVLLEGKIDAAQIAGVEKELAKYFGDDICFEVETLAELPRGAGKAQYFESLLT